MNFKPIEFTLETNKFRENLRPLCRRKQIVLPCDRYFHAFYTELYLIYRIAQWLSI